MHTTKSNDREYVTGKWAAWMDMVAYEECFHNWQSAMVLRKRTGPK